MLGGAYLLFELDGQRYGVAAGAVREITWAVATLSVPASLPHVEGALDYRGEIVAALDVRRRFGLPVRPVALTDHLILADSGRRTVALRVDLAAEVLEIADGDVSPVTGTLPGVGPVAGVARTSAGLVLIHDLESFLTETEERELARALEDLAAGPAAT
jgi:purine-binding chemotaxis protein CheW